MQDIQRHNSDTCACLPVIKLLLAEIADSCAALRHLWSCAVESEVDVALVHT